MDTVIDESNEAPIFRALNLVVVPVWAAMIVAPRSKVTARLVRWSDGLLAGLAAPSDPLERTAVEDGLDALAPDVGIEL